MGFSSWWRPLSRTWVFSKVSKQFIAVMVQPFILFKAKRLASLRTGFDPGVNSKLPRAHFYGPREEEEESEDPALAPPSWGAFLVQQTEKEPESQTEKAILGSWVVLGMRMYMPMAECIQSHTDAATLLPCHSQRTHLHPAQP